MKLGRFFSYFTVNQKSPFLNEMGSFCFSSHFNSFVIAEEGLNR